MPRDIPLSKIEQALLESASTTRDQITKIADAEWQRKASLILDAHGVAQGTFSQRGTEIVLVVEDPQLELV